MRPVPVVFLRLAFIPQLSVLSNHELDWNGVDLRREKESHGVVVGEKVARGLSS